eukprot:Opistho-2@13837
MPVDYDDRLHFDVTLIGEPSRPSLRTASGADVSASAASAGFRRDEDDIKIQSFQRSERESEILRSFANNGGARRLQEYREIPRPPSASGGQGTGDSASMQSGLAKLDAIQQRLDELQSDYVRRQEELMRRQEMARMEQTATAMDRLRDLHERQMDWQEQQLNALEGMLSRSQTSHPRLYPSVRQNASGASTSKPKKKKKSASPTKKANLGSVSGVGTDSHSGATADAATYFSPQTSFRRPDSRLSVTGRSIGLRDEYIADQYPIDLAPPPPQPAPLVSRTDATTETADASVVVRTEENEKERVEDASPLDRYLTSGRSTEASAGGKFIVGAGDNAYSRVADVMAAARRMREQLDRDSASGAGSAVQDYSSHRQPRGGGIGGVAGGSTRTDAHGSVRPVRVFGMQDGQDGYDVLMQRVVGSGTSLDPRMDESRVRHEVTRRIAAALASRDGDGGDGGGAGAAAESPERAGIGRPSSDPYGYPRVAHEQRPPSPTSGTRTGAQWGQEGYDGIYLTHLYGRPFHYPRRVTNKPHAMRYVSTPAPAPGVIRRPATVESSSLLPPRVLKVVSQPKPPRPDLRVVHIVSEQRNPLVAEKNATVDIPPAVPQPPQFIDTVVVEDEPVDYPPRAPTPPIPPAARKEPSDVPVDWVRSEVLAGLLGEIGSRLPPHPQPRVRTPTPPESPQEGIDPADIAAMVRDSLAALLAARARDRPKTPPPPKPVSPPRVSPPRRPRTPSPPRMPSPPPKARHASPPPPPSRPDRHELPVRDARRDTPPPGDVAADLPARDFASAMPRPSIDAHGGDAYSPGASPIVRRQQMVERAASPRTPTAPSVAPQSPATPASADTSSIPTTSVFTDNFISEGELLGDGYSDGEFHPRVPKGRQRRGSGSDTDEEFPGYDLSEMEVPLPHRMGAAGVLSPGEPVDFDRPVRLPYVAPTARRSIPKGRPGVLSDMSESAGEVHSLSPSDSDVTAGDASAGDIRGRQGPPYPHHTKILRPSTRQKAASAMAMAYDALETDESDGGNGSGSYGEV